MSFIARKCRRFLECFENANNYDFDTNGERMVLERLSKENLSCVFDVGANIGDWTLLAHGLLPEAKIHSFEIMESTADWLRSSVAGRSRIRVNQFGLSNSEGEVQLKCFSELSELTSMVELDHAIESSAAVGWVTTGDAYCRAEGVEHIDFLKIDVEAAEWMVMQGFERMFRSGLVDVIQFEYGTGSITTKFLLRDYYELLKGYGYALGKIYPAGVEFRDYEMQHEDFMGPNFLAVRTERQDLIRLLS